MCSCTRLSFVLLLSFCFHIGTFIAPSPLLPHHSYSQSPPPSFHPHLYIITPTYTSGPPPSPTSNHQFPHSSAPSPSPTSLLLSSHTSLIILSHLVSFKLMYFAKLSCYETLLVRVSASQCGTTINFSFTHSHMTRAALSFF